MRSSCPALLIDPERLLEGLDPVTEIKIGTDILSSFYPLLSWTGEAPIDCVEPAGLPATGDTIWVDGEGLLKPIQAALYIRGTPQVYAGKAILTGSTPDGDIAPPRISAEALRDILSIDLGSVLIQRDGNRWVMAGRPVTQEDAEALLAPLLADESPTI